MNVKCLATVLLAVFSLLQLNTQTSFAKSEESKSSKIDSLPLNKPIKTKQRIEYEFEKPDQIDVLPDILKETSGLTDVSPFEVAMVQDEKAIIFIFDLNQRKITQQVHFGPDGDYEGATRLNETIYVLESSGLLYKVNNWRTKPVVEKISLNLPTKDNEGLCFDPLESRLLISPKSRWRKGKESKNLRPLFAFDPKSGTFQKSPVLTIDIGKVAEFAKQHQISLPSKTTKKGKTSNRLRFKPASLAVHPLTKEIFVISAVDKTLASFDRNGEVTNFWKLDDKLFSKPEGITFLPDSTLIVSNEAGDNRPTLLKFKMKKL